MKRLTADLKSRALAEGFDLVGVAEAAKALSAGNLERWLDAGMHGEMGFMARTRLVRSDPRLLLPGCTSVVVVAMSYRCDQPNSTTLRADEGRSGSGSNGLAPNGEPVSTPHRSSNGSGPQGQDWVGSGKTLFSSAASSVPSSFSVFF